MRKDMRMEGKILLFLFINMYFIFTYLYVRTVKINCISVFFTQPLLYGHMLLKTIIIGNGVCYIPYSGGIIGQISRSYHFLLFFLLPPWRAVRSYWLHLEVRDPIWGDDRSHSPFIRRSLSWGFPGFSSAKENTRRSVHSPRDHFIITFIIRD